MSWDIVKIWMVKFGNPNPNPNPNPTLTSDSPILPRFSSAKNLRYMVIQFDSMVEDKNGWHTGEMTNSFIENHF